MCLLGACCFGGVLLLYMALIYRGNKKLDKKERKRILFVTILSLACSSFFFFTDTINLIIDYCNKYIGFVTKMVIKL